MRKVLFGALLFFTANASAQITIGISAPLTGPAATYGEDSRNVLSFANEKLSGGKYRLAVEDDRCDAKSAATIAHHFTGVLKVRAVLGLPCSSATLAAAPIYEQAKVLVITAGSSAPAVARAGDYIFRTWPNDVLSAKVLFDYWRNRPEIIGAISEETPFCQGFMQALQQLNSPARIRLQNENFLPDSDDFRTQLARLKQSGVTALLINTQTEAGYLKVLRQAKESGLNVQFFGIQWPGSPAVLDNAKADIEGTVFVDSPLLDESLSPEGQALFAEFVARYGRPKSSPFHFVTLFESFRAAHAALSQNGGVPQFLYSRSFDGIAGSYSFDKNGDIAGVKPRIFRIINGAVSAI